LSTRQRDEIWDQLDLHFGPVRTKGERGRRNVAVKELREAGATPEEVTVAYEWCKKSFTTFTEVAVCQHFGRAQHERIQHGPTTLSLVQRMAQGGSDAAG
jgi:hypothetical protein